MHVHADYSQSLATLGVNRDEAQEMATRRAADTRRRLSAAADKLLSTDDDAVAFVKASESSDSGPEGDAYSTADGDQQQPDADPPSQREQGSHFSARA